MRMLEIPNLEYSTYREIADTILKIIPFSLVNMEYSKKLNTGFFYFWDVSYIPESLIQYARFPPKTHENVEKLHKEIEEIFSKVRTWKKNNAIKMVKSVK